MKSPLTGVDMPSTTLIPNHSFKKAIETAVEAAEAAEAAAEAAEETTREGDACLAAIRGKRKR